MKFKKTMARSFNMAAAVPALLLLHTAAYADETENDAPEREFYVQMDMGVSPRSHATLEGAKTGRINFDGSVFPAALTLGWKPEGMQSDTGSLAFELQAYDRNLSIDTLTVGNTAAVSSDGKYNVGGIMANVRYELKPGSVVRPYVTGGVGVACAELKKVPQLQLAKSRARNVDLAAHVGGGIGFQPGAQSRFSLWLGYDLLLTRSPRFDSLPTAPANVGYVRARRIQPQTFTFGGRFAF